APKSQRSCKMKKAVRPEHDFTGIELPKFIAPRWWLDDFVEAICGRTHCGLLRLSLLDGRQQRRNVVHRAGRLAIAYRRPKIGFRPGDSLIDLSRGAERRLALDFAQSVRVADAKLGGVLFLFHDAARPARAPTGLARMVLRRAHGRLEIRVAPVAIAFAI